MTMFQSPQTESLYQALSAAQGELTDAAKSSENPHFKSKYADLATVLQALRPILSKHGLALIQTAGSYSKTDGTVSVTTLLAHKSGQFVTDTLNVPVSKPDAQGVGAAITYARRYGAAAICGLAQDDDDGETAVGRGAVKAKSKGKDTPVPPPTMTEAQLVEEFHDATKESLPKLAPAFASLDAEAQARVLPHVKEARARLGI